MNTGISILDNHSEQAKKISSTLSQFNKELTWFSNEEDLYERLREARTELVFIHLDFKPNDAVAILGEIHQRFPDFKGLLVVYSEVQDEYVQELVYNSGADAFINFINKPLILQLFVRNLLRRREFLVTAANLELGVDKEQFQINYQGKQFQLPRKEFLIVDLLYQHKGRYFTKTEIAEQIWGDRMVAAKRRIDVHIYNIRQILGEDVIGCRRGKGYVLNS